MGAFRANGGDRIYQLTCGGVTHISAFEGAVLFALNADWADAEYVDNIEVPADVNEWLLSL